MRKLKIGENFSFPVEVVTSTLIIYGGKGMGKTNLGSVLVEELDGAGLRWCALDPLGAWWGLRHSEDGKGKGIECLILGGTHGDIPIEPTGGAIVADLVVDESANVIIDFSRRPNGQMWSIGEKIQFVTDYTYRLFQRQGELVGGRRREPIFQLLDEAARYIPQTIRAGDEKMAMCVAAWEQMVEEGRNIGIGVGLLTQRSARMAKSVSELADAVIAFRIVGPNSIGAITDWLGEHVPKAQVNAMVEKIRQLDVGTALVVSPGWLKYEGVVKFRKRKTFDSSATPKPGERGRKVTGSGAKPDLAKYAERMAATIERAKENDPRALKAQIAELKKDLAKKQPAPAAVKTAGVDLAQLKASNQVREALSARLHEAMKIITKIEAIGFEGAAVKPEDLEKALQSASSQIVKLVESKIAAKAANLESLKKEAQRVLAQIRAVLKDGDKDLEVSVQVKRQEPFAVTRTAHIESNGDLSRPQMRILSAIAQFEAIGRTSIDKKWIAAMAEASHTSSAFSNNLSTLRTGGYISYPSGGEVALTDLGRSTAPAVDHPSTSVEMIARCKTLLSAPQARILDVLVDNYPTAMDKDAVADLAGASSTSSAYSNNLSSMRSAGMIDYPEKGKLIAQKWLFLEVA